MSSKKRISIVVVTFFATVVVACSGSSDDAGTSGSSGFVAEYCDLVGGTCCPKEGKAYNGQTCKALLGIGGAQSDVVFDQAAANQCIASIRAALNTPTFCNNLGGEEVNKPCDAVFKAKGGAVKAPGTACESDRECAPDPNGDVECSFTGTTASDRSRTCVLRVRAKEGEPCVGDKIATRNGTTISTGSEDGPRLNVCWESDDLSCTSASGNQPRVCKKRVAVDAACTSGDKCVKGANCDGTKCVAAAAIGAECGRSAAGVCVDGAFCDPSTFKCAAQVPTGGACTRNQECGQFGSCTNGKCEGGSSLGVGLFICGGD